jgi:hypothetical protein
MNRISIQGRERHERPVFSLNWRVGRLPCLGVAQPQKKKKKALVLGIGLDSDGHKRVTTGPNFALVGGTEETHEAMTEKAIKINEKLAAKGKRLEDISSAEFDEIANAVGLQRRPDKKNEKE